MYRIPSTLNGDLDYTQSLIDQFKAGEIQAGQLKSNRVPMGIYEQRKNQHYMLAPSLCRRSRHPRAACQDCLCGSPALHFASPRYHPTGDSDSQC